MENAITPRRRFQFTMSEMLLTLAATCIGMKLLNPILFPNAKEVGSIITIMATACGASIALCFCEPMSRMRKPVLVGYIVLSWAIMLFVGAIMSLPAASSAVFGVGATPLLVGFFVALRRLCYTTHERRRIVVPIFCATSLSMALSALMVGVVVPKLFSRMGTCCEMVGACECKAFAEAEEIYHRTDYTGNGVLKYAQHLKGKDSLLEQTAGTGNLALIDKSFGVAEIGGINMTPRAGYVFKILTAQGPYATGGARNYIDKNGNMTLGYALVACPYQYRRGRVTYMISGNGTIFQKDLGPSTPFIVSQMTEYDPDSTWVPTP